MGMTACFLPKPIAGLNGNGMHCNLSLSKGKTNTFYNKQDGKLSPLAINFIERILHNANDICLVLNPSVNAYRRLDPAYEAPNQIKYSDIDRTSMVRIPLGNEKSARIEVRTVAPDANPYLVFLTLLRIGLEGPQSAAEEQKRNRTRILPDNIYVALRHFKSSDFMTQLLGTETKEKYAALKQTSANRCPKDLGNLVKSSEILFHHEVTNQYIWSQF
jgi:glutamine synthetase